MVFSVPYHTILLHSLEDWCGGREAFHSWSEMRLETHTLIKEASMCSEVTYQTPLQKLILLKDVRAIVLGCSFTGHQQVTESNESAA